MTRNIRPFLIANFLLAGLASYAAAQSGYDSVAETRKMIGKLQVGKADWPQAGGSSLRNSVTDTEVPTSWDVGSGENIRWVAPLGSTTYGNPVVANGQVFVGTNNGGGFIKRLPKDVDLGVLLCVGVLCMLLFHIFENVGMNLGIMPITGIPLPLVSQGGSSVVATFLALGLVQSVHMHRFN